MKKHVFLFTTLSLGFLLSCSNDDDDLYRKIDSQLQSFKRGDALLDFRDGRAYNTVNVGAYTWMADNLNYKAERYTCFNDSLIYCEKYGVLYDWEMAKSVCPAGWHLPSVAEWFDIVKYFGDEERVAAAVLQSENGFSIPVGYGSGGCSHIRLSDVDCRAIGFQHGYPCHCDYSFNTWWSITSDGNEEAYRYSVLIDAYRTTIISVNTYSGIQSGDKRHFNHIRCVKDYN
jgi:uncharacterized protein (TIGR02145 family)